MISISLAIFHHSMIQNIKLQHIHLAEQYLVVTYPGINFQYEIVAKRVNGNQILINFDTYRKIISHEL